MFNAINKTEAKERDRAWRGSGGKLRQEGRIVIVIVFFLAPYSPKGGIGLVTINREGGREGGREFEIIHFLSPPGSGGFSEVKLLRLNTWISVSFFFFTVNQRW